MARILTKLLAAAVLSLGVLPTSAFAAATYCKNGECVTFWGMRPTLEECNRYAAGGGGGVCFMAIVTNPSNDGTVLLGGARQSLLMLSAAEERSLGALIRAQPSTGNVNRFETMMSRIAARQPARDRAPAPSARMD